MSQNRHISAIVNFRSSKKRRRKSQQTGVSYENLEERKLLAANILFDVDTGGFGRSGPVSSNQEAGIGPAHIVEVTNGAFRVFNRDTGALLQEQTLTNFWTGTGLGAAGADASFIGAPIASSKILYDVDTRRWFMASAGTGDVITGAPGVQAFNMLAVSRTSNPLQDWSSVDDFYDVDANADTADVGLAGGFRQQSTGQVSLSVDDNNVYVGSGRSVFAFNKAEDLLIPDPRAAIQFFGIRIPVYASGDLDGVTEFGADVYGTQQPQTVGISTTRGGGDTIGITTVSMPEVRGGVTFDDVIDVDVDPYLPPPVRVRQLFDSDINYVDSAGMDTQAVIEGDSLWAVHPVLGASGTTAAIRWYEIDLLTNTVKQSGNIEHADRNYIYPSITVTQERAVVITYTSSGIDQFPTMTVSMGYDNNGVLLLEAPRDLKEGQDGYLDGRGNFWGDSTATLADLGDPTRVYAFGQWSNASNDGVSSMIGLELQGYSAVLAADANPNEIIVRRSATDATQIEVLFDGTIVESYLETMLFSISIDGGGGDDTFIVDTSNGVFEFAGGLSLIGDGDDQLVVESALDTAWMVDGDGAGSLAPEASNSISFAGMNRLVGAHAVDTFNVTNTATDIAIDTREGADEMTIGNMGIGVLTINTGSDMDVVSITNSGGGVNLLSDEGDDDVTVTDLGTGVVTIDTGVGMDNVSLMTVGAGGVVLTTGENDDTVVIDNAAGVGPIAVTGGLGNDTFTVVNSGVGDISLMGQMGDDTYMIMAADLAVNLAIADTVDSENDVLVAYGTVADDVLNISGTGASLNGAGEWLVSGVEEYTFNSLEGDDVVGVNLGGTNARKVTILGSQGNDHMTVQSNGDAMLELQGGLGDDDYTVFFGLDTEASITDSVGDENDTFFGFGTANDDTLLIDGATTNINGGSVSVVGIENLIVDAVGGEDDINVVAIVGDTTVRGGTGDDTITASGLLTGGTMEGGAGDDIFHVDQTLGGGTYSGGADDDIFNILEVQGTNEFQGDGGVDSFFVTNHLPLDTTSGLIDIDGGTDRNIIEVNGYQTQGNDVTITDNRITGLSAVPIQYAAAGSFSLGSDIGGIKLTGSDNHVDRFDAVGVVAGDSLLMLGQGGDDVFTVRAATRGRVSSDGGEGSDRYQYAIGSANSRFLNALDTGVTGSDRIIASLTSGDDNLVLSGESFRVDTDSFGFNQNFESMIVNAQAGDDTVEINRVRVGFLRVLGQDGNDDVQINNFTGIDTISLEGGEGNDTVGVNSGNVSGVLLANGGNGDDTFFISQGSYGDAYIDGQEGSDTYDIRVADRSMRFINARDSGTVGTDEITVTGTVLDDRAELRSGIVKFANQRVLFNENTEKATIKTGGAEDIVQIYGFASPDTTVMAEAGEDLVFVNSTFGPVEVKTLTVDLGVGNDTAVVTSTRIGTTTSIYGQLGIDVANIGSTLAQNNGNLGRIQGPVHFDGGDGADRLNLNDVGRGASVNYDVGPGFMRTGAGSSSNAMAEISYAGIERLRLEGTPFRNHVNVTASTETAYSFFGDGGYNTIAVEGDSTDGRQFFGENGEKGTWTFDNDQKDIYFEDFFIMI